MTSEHKAIFTLGGAVICLILIIILQARVLKDVADIEYIAPEPVCTSLECEVDRRTVQVFEREQSNFMEQSRLMALEELNDEMTELITNPKKRLNN